MSNSVKSDGFQKDCLKLLGNFRDNNGIDFSNFCEEWKAMNFQYIFSGFRSDLEMIYNINEYFITLKGLFVQSPSLLDKVGILYLMYAIYYKQPPKEYCKIKVNLDEWKVFKEFYEKLHSHDEFNKIKLIFWTLLRSGAFVFVESDRKYSFEYFMRREFDEEAVKENPNTFRSTYAREEAKFTNSETGILPAIKFLEDAYNEMKDLLDSSAQQGTRRTEKSLPNTSIVSELFNGFRNISNIFEVSSGVTSDHHDTGNNSTDSEELREQVETSIKQRRDAIKRRALTIDDKSAAVVNKNDDADDPDDPEFNSDDGLDDVHSDTDEDDEMKSKAEATKKQKRVINNSKVRITNNESSLKISFPYFKSKYPPNKSTCEKILDSIGKEAADELQEQRIVDVVQPATVQPSLDGVL